MGVLVTLVIVTLFLMSCSGFLFDDLTTPPSNSGSSLSDQNFIALVRMITQERHSRETYMIQLKQKILENANTASVLQAKINVIASDNDTFVDKRDFDQLKTDFKSLEKKYALIVGENDQLKHQINSSVLLMNQMKQELDELKNLNSINELQEIQNLKTDNAMVKQELQNTNNRINGLKSTQQARGQDFLAIYNQTLDMKVQIIKQNQTSHLLKEEVKKGDMEVENKMQQIKKDHNESVLEIQESISNITKEKAKLANELNQLEKSTLHKISEANNLFFENAKKVAVTACATTGTYHANVPIPFPSIVTSYGMSSLSSLKSNGLFTCEHFGLYIVSVTIMSDRQDGYFHVYKNNAYFVDVYLQSDNSNYHSGTAMVVVDMTVNDTISVKPFYDNSEVYGSSSRQGSCLTVVKVK